MTDKNTLVIFFAWNITYENNQNYTDMTTDDESVASVLSKRYQKKAWIRWVDDL